MRNKQLWKPSKFVITKGRYMASRDPAEVGIGSRFMADIIAGVYERNVREHASRTPSRSWLWQDSSL